LLFVNLAKLFLFSIFISAVVEVIKGFLVEVGDKKPLSGQSIKVLTFAFALLYAKAFDYGAMSKILAIDYGENRFAGFLDYVGTAALVYNGADWAFNKFSAIKAKLQTVQQNAGKPTDESK